MEDLTPFKNIQKAKNKKLLEISNEKKIEKQIDLYNELLKIDNTDRKILLQYLNFCIQINGGTSNMKVEMKEDFNKYSKYFPPEEWNINFSAVIEKKNSSLEKLDLIFQKISSKNWITTGDNSKKELLNYFLENIKECAGEIGNTYPITWKNDELFIYYLLNEFLKQLQEKIAYYSEDSQIQIIENDLISFYNKEIDKLEIQILKVSHNEEDELKILRKKIKGFKKERLSIGFNKGGFFSEYLNNFYYFILSIKDTYLKDFSKRKFDKKEEQNTFEYFMLYISNYDFEKIPEYMYSVWKYSFIPLNSNEEEAIFLEFINNNKLEQFEKLTGDKIKIVFSKNTKKEFVIDNYKDYELKSLFHEITLIGKFNEYEFIKYVKIDKINKHIYIKKIMNEWISFNVRIFNSQTIQSLYNFLFTNYDHTIFEGNELKIILENIIYFTFPTDFIGLTMRRIMKTFEYGAMFIIDGEEDLSKVITLAISLICNMHEILGHYNIGYQIYSNPKETKNLDSPKIDEKIASEYAKNRDFKESGENIEIKLFGRKITYLTLKEALFILDPNNYKIDYEQFRKNFQNCNNAEIKIEENFQNILVAFKINVKAINKGKKLKFYIGDQIKKYKDQIICTIKENHPRNFNIDGANNNDYNSLEQLITSMKNHKPETNI